MIINHLKTIVFAILGVFCTIVATPMWAAASQEQEKMDSMDYEQLKIKS